MSARKRGRPGAGGGHGRREGGRDERREGGRDERREGGRGERREAGTNAPARRPGAGRRRAVTALVSLLIVALAAFVLWSRRDWFFPRATPPAPLEATAPAPEPGLTLQQESNVATRLVNEGHAMASLPYYRHLLTMLPDDLHVRFNYVTAINNAALESRVRPAMGGPVTRSSVERVALMREALAQLELLAARSRSPHEQAMVHELRARLYKNWGFLWETVLELRVAQRLDPAWHQVALNADLFVWLLHHPEANLDSIP